MTDRIVVLIDMDCFYVQVEERYDSSLKGKPAAVVQYKTFKGGGIIAVNYEARACGVTRSMRGDDAKQQCPEIILVRVPEERGKANLTKYRDCGKEVIDVLCKHCSCIERASIDEAYLDITTEVDQRLSDIQGSGRVNVELLRSTFVVGWDGEGDTEEERRLSGLSAFATQAYDSIDNSDLRMIVGAVIAEEMRKDVFETTGFKCSAGIAANKMLAKLACGLHKPNRQTVLPVASIPDFFAGFPLKKVRNLGGKFGRTLMEEMGCKTMGDVAALSFTVLERRFGTETATWLRRYSRGIDDEEVSNRRLPKSIGCGKNFNGPEALTTKQKVFYWLGQLVEEVVERLTKDREANKRVAKTVTLHAAHDEGSFSRAFPLRSYDAKKLHQDAFTVLLKERTSPNDSDLWIPPLKNLSLSAGKFQPDESTKSGRIDCFFRKISEKSSKAGSEAENRPMDEEKLTQHLFIENKSESSESDGDLESESECMDLDEIRPKNCNPHARNDANSSVINTDTPSVSSASGALSNSASDLTGRSENSNKSTTVSEKVGKGFFARKLQENTLKGPRPLSPLETVPVSKAPPITHLASESDIVNVGSNDHTTSDVEAAEAAGLQALLKAKNKSKPDSAADFIDVSELFPNGEIDPEILESLPSEMRKKITNNLVVQKAKSTGKHALSDVGIKKFIPKADEFSILCEKCSAKIPVWEVDEHRDYHVALDLQKSLRQNEQADSSERTIPSGSVAKTVNGKRKKESKGKEGKTRRIEEFFSR